MKVVLGIESGYLAYAEVVTEEQFEEAVEKMLEICNNPDYDDVYSLDILNGEVEITHHILEDE